MDGVKIILKAQAASAEIAHHVARAKTLLATADCRLQSEEKTLVQVYELSERLRATRKELAAALRLIRRTTWPKAAPATPMCAGGLTSSPLACLRSSRKGQAMDARNGPWHGGSGQNLPMPVLRELATNEIRRLTRRVRRPPRQLLLLAMNGFMRWCIPQRGITDGHDVTASVAKEQQRQRERRSGGRQGWVMSVAAKSLPLKSSGTPRFSARA
jgi:hypothetical protein